jgi:hypothetical protein
MCKYSAGILAAVKINIDTQLLVGLERRPYTAGGCNLQPRSKGERAFHFVCVVLLVLTGPGPKAADFNGIVVQEIQSMLAVEIIASK